MATNGTLEGISLAGFLQMVQAERKDNILLEILNKEGKKGIIYCSEGQLVNALTLNNKADVVAAVVDNKADAAVVEMISWKKQICITICIRNKCEKFKKQIKTNLFALIIQASEC